MKAQSGAFLEKSIDLIERAGAMLGADLYEDAGRTAYLAGFHAAQALIFETHGRTFKSHSSVHAEFSRLTKDAPGTNLELRAFLGRTYNLKAIADYETGPGARIGKEHASEAVAAGRRFIAHVTALIETPDQAM